MADVPLSPRQVEVCGLVANGDSDKIIGKALGCSARTVQSHMKVAAKRINKALGWDDQRSPRKIILRYYLWAASVSYEQEQGEAKKAA